MICYIHHIVVIARIVFIADILNVSCHEELFDEAGRLCLERANLLAYAHGEYFSLGEKLGKFGFSTAKSQTKVVKSRKNAVQKEDRQSASNKTADSKTATEQKEPFYLAVAKHNRKRGGKRK